LKLEYINPIMPSHLRATVFIKYRFYVFLFHMDRGFYRVAGSTFAALLQGKGTLKNLVLNARTNRKSNLMAILAEAYKLVDVLRALYEDTALETTFPKKHPDAVSYETGLILIYEFLWSPILHGDSGRHAKAMAAFLTAFPLIAHNKTRISAEWTRFKLKRGITCKEDLLVPLPAALAAIPRYARINTLLPKAEERILAALGARGLHVKSARRAESEEPWQPLTVYRDTHIPGLLAFPPKTALHQDALVSDGLLILQDKASCFPAFLLDPPPEAHVLDACAAPGNKTTQLATFLHPSIGSLIAVEKDGKRFQLLKSMCSKAKISSNLVSFRHADFLGIDPFASPFHQVDYILLDPSCSGSGMLARLDNSFVEIESIEAESLDPQLPPMNAAVKTSASLQKSLDPKNDRLRRLANFQISALKHAFRFPALKQLVYSTCSIHKEENELVVAEVLSQSKGQFRLVQNLLPSWPHRGIPIEGVLSPEDAACLIRADPLQDLCNGFFVAKFERLPA
jgi:25S rRNA (cytosine2278-C5)-methyltransferase